MFDNLTRKVSSALGQLGGKRTLDENNIAETLRTVRLALLEADVALSVVQTFLDRVRARLWAVRLPQVCRQASPS